MYDINAAFTSAENITPEDKMTLTHDRSHRVGSAANALNNGLAIASPMMLIVLTFSRSTVFHTLADPLEQAGAAVGAFGRLQLAGQRDQARDELRRAHDGAAAALEKVSVALYTAALPLSFVNPWIADALYFAVACIWLSPDRRVEKLTAE